MGGYQDPEPFPGCKDNYICGTMGPEQTDMLQYLADYPLAALFVNFYDANWGGKDDWGNIGGICESSQYNDDVGNIPSFTQNRQSMCDPNEDAYGQTLCIRFWKSDTWNPFNDNAQRPGWDDVTQGGVGQYSVPVSQLCDQYSGAEITTKDFSWINSDWSDGGQYPG